MDLKKLKETKSRLLVDLDLAKRGSNRREANRLGSEVARLEGLIASESLKSECNEKAVINLISQASCLIDSNRYAEAVRIFKKALSTSGIAKTREWIFEALEQIKEHD
jgi:glycerol-3-phosphate responsive antiterminator